MKIDINVDIHHLTRVEGHGNIHINVQNGELVDAKWAVVETPRFFEAILCGKSYDMAPILASRICGICSIGHTLASLRAVERAMQIKIPESAQLLRILAKHGETLQSHILHVLFLSSPDFLGTGSVLPIIKSHPQIANIAVTLKQLGNDICNLIAGRATHPVCLIVGGVSKSPEKKQLNLLKIRIKEQIPDMLVILDVFKSLSMPDFVRETEFVSLKGKNSYPWIGGDMISTNGIEKNEDDYLSMTNEYKEDFSTSKFTRLSRESFAVGALARFNNNHRFLHKEAQEAAQMLGLTHINYNPYMNNIAQLVESYHILLESIEIIERLIDSDMQDIFTNYKILAGHGVGAIEAPRGILYHDYTIDEQGIITRTNCIIPTTQNNANIHYDLKALVKKQVEMGKDDKEIIRLSEMLVRAYDPCISCSVH